MSAPVNPVNQPGYDDLSDEDRRAALLAWAAELERANKERQDEAFEVLPVPDGFFGALLYTRACTSLSDEEATERINRVPSGTRHGWVLLTEGDGAPVQCQEKPTHRHLVWEC